LPNDAAAFRKNVLHFLADLKNLKNLKNLKKCGMRMPQCIKKRLFVIVTFLLEWGNGTGFGT
jgi:hypothetical protein